jgi:alanine racemase
LSDTSAAGMQITVDLGALAENWRELAGRAAPAECAAVVKADAYGIGIEAAVPALRTAGCRTFFVALPEEGRRVRAAAPEATVYVLNGFFVEAAEFYRSADLRPVLSSPEDIETWAALGDRSPAALQFDTGMNRLGLSLHEAVSLARSPERLAAINPRLLMSHLACADTPPHVLNQSQLTLFREIAAEFPKVPLSLANSAAIFLGGAYHFDLARPGIALYGAAFAEGRPPLRNVVTARARILQIRDAEAGETVGYGAAQRLDNDARVAIVSAGYADGYLRRAGKDGDKPVAHAFIRGRTVPLLGRVSMDLLALDVTAIPGVGQGDWVELFGSNIPVDEVAAAAGSIGYELLTGLSRRAEQVYVNAPGASVHG